MSIFFVPRELREARAAHTHQLPYRVAQGLEEPSPAHQKILTQDQAPQTSGVPVQLSHSFPPLHEESQVFPFAEMLAELNHQQERQQVICFAQRSGHIPAQLISFIWWYPNAFGDARGTTQQLNIGEMQFLTDHAPTLGYIGKGDAGTALTCCKNS